MRTAFWYGAPAACVLVLGLGGCGLPPAISVAGLAVDGVSYLASGKSVGDHAISQATSQDCALFRVVQDEAICRDAESEHGATTTAAAADGPAEAADPVIVPADVAHLTEGLPATLVAAAPAGDGLATAVPFGLAAQPVARPTAPPPVLAPTPELRSLGRVPATVAGSFLDEANARALARRLADLAPRVVSTRIGGRDLHRVVVEVPVGALRARGIEDAWTTHLCAAGRTLPPCDPSVADGAGDLAAAG